MADFTYTQIAKMLGKTEMAIKALQRRGLATMARLMTSSYATGGAKQAE